MYEIKPKSISSKPVILETWLRPVEQYTVLETIPALASLKVNFLNNERGFPRQKPF